MLPSRSSIASFVALAFMTLSASAFVQGQATTVPARQFDVTIDEESAAAPASGAAPAAITVEGRPLDANAIAQVAESLAAVAASPPEAASPESAGQVTPPGAAPWPGQYGPAFDFTFTTANRRRLPGLTLFEAISDSERKLLTEDLQILSVLLNKAVGGPGAVEPASDSLLGLAVNRSETTHSIEFLQGHGVVFRYHTPWMVFAARAEQSNGGSAAQPDEESAWEEARRELYARERIVQGFPMTNPLTGRMNRNLPKYDSGEIARLKERIAKVLQEVKRIHFPQSSSGARQTVSVVLSSGADGSVMTMRTSLEPGADGTGNVVAPPSTFQYFDSTLVDSSVTGDMQRLYAPFTAPAAAVPQRIDALSPLDSSATTLAPAQSGR